MSTDFITIVKGHIYCSYCATELSEGEECSCKASLRAKQKASKKVAEKQHQSPEHRFDRPPRRLAK